MSDRPHPTLGELLDPTGRHAFVATLELMDSFGCRFAVRPPGDVGYDGAVLPDWCDAVIVAWLELIVAAYAGCSTSHHLYACTECCWPMLLRSDRAGRRCPVCSTANAMTYRLPLRFTNPPRRRRRAA